MNQLIIMSLVLENWTVYVRPAVDLVRRDVVEALSRGPVEGSRKVVVGYFLSTWLWPSSSKPDSTPCCLLCLLLSNRSFPKNASWTWKHKALRQLCVHTFLQELSAYLTCYHSRGAHHHVTKRIFSIYWRPKWTDRSETEKLLNSHVAAGLNFVSTYLPQLLIPISHLLCSMTCNCSPLLHTDIKNPTCCHFNN